MSPHRSIPQTCSLIALLWLFLAAPSLALPVTVQWLEGPARARFSVYGEVVFELIDASPQEAERVRKQLEAGTEFKVTASGPDAILWVSGQQLGSINPGQAERWNTTPYSLAATFVERLRKATQGAPALRFEPDGLIVPLDEGREAVVVGGLAQAPEVSNSNPGAATVEFDGKRVRLKGLAAGDGRIRLDWGSRTLELPFKVRPWAGRLPESVNLRLTGRLEPAVFREALERELLNGLYPGAKLSVAVPAKLEGGSFELAASAEGPGLLPVSGKLKVNLNKQEFNLAEAQALALSNRPEKILSTGWLFDRALPTGPTRVLYHHRNDPGGPERYLEMLVENLDSKPNRFHTVMASYGPSPDEIHVGHTATLRFVERVLSDEGQMLSLEAGQTRLLDRLRMKPGQTVSGMAYLTPLDGARLRLKLRVVSQTEEFVDDYAPTPPNSRTARGLYAPSVSQNYSHQLGGRYTYITLGDTPFLEDPETGEASPGNFGAVYRLQLALYNPADEVREAWLEFVPGGGPARGVVLVDNRLLDVAMGNSRTRIPLARWELEPGERRYVNIETIPQSGSNYPVRLVVQSQFESREDLEVEAQAAPPPLIP